MEQTEQEKKEAVARRMADVSLNISLPGGLTASPSETLE